MIKRWVVSYLPRNSQYDNSQAFDSEEEALMNVKDVAGISQHGEAIIYEQSREDTITSTGPMVKWTTTRIGIQRAGEDLVWDDDP